MRGADEAITVWNRHHTRDGDTWYRHEVKGCSWESEIIRTVGSDGTAKLASAYTVLVDANEDYLPPYEWEASADKATRFTLQVGDLVARGIQAVEITVVAPYTLALVRDSLAEAFTIKAATDLTQGYKYGAHYEVTGV